MFFEKLVDNPVGINYFRNDFLEFMHKEMEGGLTPYQMVIDYLIRGTSELHYFSTHSPFSSDVKKEESYRQIYEAINQLMSSNQLMTNNYNAPWKIQIGDGGTLWLVIGLDDRERFPYFDHIILDLTERNDFNLLPSANHWDRITSNIENFCNQVINYSSDEINANGNYVDVTKRINDALAYSKDELFKVRNSSPMNKRVVYQFILPFIHRITIIQKEYNSCISEIPKCF